MLRKSSTFLGLGTRLATAVTHVEVDNLRNLITFRASFAAPTTTTTEQQTSSSSSSSSLATDSVQVSREWLFDNDVALRHSTGQKTKSLFDLPSFSTPSRSYESLLTVHRVQLPPSEEQNPHGAAGEGQPVRLIKFLVGGDNAAQPHEIAIRESDVLKYLFGKKTLGRVVPLAHVSKIKRVTMSDFVDDIQRSAHVEALQALARDGILLVQNCPPEDESVLRIARAIDREMPTLYDTTFKVVSAPKSGPKNNVAYSQVELDLHQDIAYYESMPGLQLLHCQKFDARCTGGESTFLDVIHAGELLRERNPDAFRVLCEVPAAFMKDDWDRPVPAQYYYATPHFHVNDLGEITKCFWSPAFEAPAPPTPRMGEYYAARKVFCDLIAELKRSPLYLQFRLQEGDCVVFHQGRMLHGRREFTEPEPGARQLHGCYVHVDAFRNAVVTRLGLAKKQNALKGGSVVETVTHGFTNQSWR